MPLPADLERFVRSELRAGRYASRTALIAEALRLLRRRDELMAQLQAKIAERAKGETPKPKPKPRAKTARKSRTV